MRKRLQKPSKSMVLIGGVVVLAIFLALTATGVLRIPLVDTVVRVVFVPVQKFFTDTVRNTQQYFLDIAYQGELESQYQQLQAENAALREEISASQELEKENERLQELLGMAREYGPDATVTGRVVGMSPGNWFSSFTIDVGASHGIQKDDPVVNADGLVGRVLEVYDGYCTVISIVDAQSAVGGLVERTRDNGMVHGNLYLGEEAESCHMLYLPKDAEYQPGDRILTNGLDGVYPKGLLIGTVSGISRDETVDRFLVIQPAVKLANVEEVAVLIGGAYPWAEGEGATP